MKRSRILARVIMLISLTAVVQMVGVLADEKPKTASLKGKVFRSDTKEPIANASIILLDDKKSEKQDSSVEAQTDDQGNYIFPNVPSGKIHSFHQSLVQDPGRCALIKR